VESGVGSASEEQEERKSNPKVWAIGRLSTQRYISFLRSHSIYTYQILLIRNAHGLTSPFKNTNVL
jgi:hypothetical protein